MIEELPILTMENYWGVEELCEDGGATNIMTTATTVLNIFFDDQDQQAVPVVSFQIGLQKLVEIEHENQSERFEPKVVELDENNEPKPKNESETKSKVKSISLDIVQVQLVSEIQTGMDF